MPFVCLIGAQEAWYSNLTVLSLDISAAYDTVSCEAMLSAWAAMPEASTLLPFARLRYAREPVYVWIAGSNSHRVTQAGGGRQGHPLMPALRDLQANPRQGCNSILG